MLSVPSAQYNREFPQKDYLKPEMTGDLLTRNLRTTSRSDGFLVTQLDKVNFAKLQVSNGFRSWIRTRYIKGQKQLKRKLRSKIKEGKDVWASIMNRSTLVGYAVVGNAEGLPGAKVIESIEVATQYRQAGIGSMVLSRIIEEHQDTIIILDPSPEEGFERKLSSFYNKFGFREIGELMFRIPSNEKSARSWIPILTRAIKTYDAMIRHMRKATRTENHFR